MNNAQKTPLSRTLSRYVAGVAESQIARRLIELPCTVVSVNAAGTIVTVNFEVPDLNIPQATMPVRVSKYARTPIQPGDAGLARAATAYIGTISGLGIGSPASADLQPNLSAMVWEPISNADWGGSAENNVLTDVTGASVLELTPTGITLSFGGHAISIDSTGVSIDGYYFLKHEHGPGTYVVSSSPVTGISGEVIGEGP
jgi:hypothetical protein